MDLDGLDVAPRTSGGNDRVRADIDAAEVFVTRGEAAVVQVEVTNVDRIIRSFQVGVLGLDPDWIEVGDTVLDLFPGERRDVLVAFTLPEAFPSGRRSVAIEVSEPTAEDDAAVLLAFDLVVTPLEGLTLKVEPEAITIGRDGSVLLHPASTGNTIADVSFTAVDPERLTTTIFEPPAVRLLPGEQGVTRATITGQRPWFGVPAVRLVTFTAAAGAVSVDAVAVVMQRPRIGRRLLTFLGLLAVMSLFAFVILQAFGSVADRAAASEKLLAQGFGSHDTARATSAGISGRVTSTTAGGVDGAAVALFDAASPTLPIRSTVTDAGGRYRFGSLAEGSYLLRVDVAGFGERWYPEGESVAEAEPVDITSGTASPDDIDITLVGRPGSVAGTVLGEDVTGATVAVEIPGASIEGSDLEPAAAVVASVELDATGRFVLEDLPTPATYDLLVSKPGFATDASTVALQAGEQRDGLEVLLRRGDGRITGTVVDTSGEPLPNVSISATDGVTTTPTRTLSSGADRGSFELRDLPTPGTYTLTVTAEGYFDHSVTVPLDAEERVLGLQVVLTSGRGSLTGRVTDPEGRGLGGVDITIVGADVESQTTSLSADEVGTWFVDDLPVPGTYTVTFARRGMTTQALSVELVPGPAATRSGVDAVLAPATASVHGMVTDPAGEALSGVVIVLHDGELERRTISSDVPPGRYRLDEVPPGVYTITFSRPGSRPQTQLVDLRGGDVREVSVVLEHQARLRGTVTSGQGATPESGVGVLVYKQAEYPQTVVAQTVTAADGTYEIIGLEAPETYVVEFRIPAGGPIAGSETRFVQAGATITVDFHS
ncbi:carboxypeptidase-like regulatory domain-containing protein [Nitriliruptor alkaliphilus]|uniref:carboxypeptidase-like regulatory domain-containing protein n=1 Tax=Nitriliruptor alkaliphilus TaxID=427918 RepID=UPI000697B461|nr:carboxypeptidase-like regulatory domain-containing protein [Nitriliruptor alkaliphilus]